MLINEIVCEGRFQGTPLLYHATSTDGAIDILRRGVIEPRTQAGINGRPSSGVSLTRSFWFASAFGTVIFGLNLNTMRDQHRGRMYPHADPSIEDAAHAEGLPSVGDYRREAEEFVVGPVALAGHLVAIWVSDQSGADDPWHPKSTAAVAEVMRHPLYQGVVPQWPYRPPAL